MRSAGEIRDWLVSHVARELGLDPGAVDVGAPLSRFGLDSVAAIGLACDLEEWLGRELPPDVVSDYPSIEALAGRLAGTLPAPPVVAGARAISVEGRGPFAQRVVRRAVLGLVRLLTRIEVEGRERLPARGPYLLASNHLHVFDAALLFFAVEQPLVFFVSEHMKAFPFVDWFLRRVGRPVYVSRGKADREAVAGALAALRAGDILVVAPEGRISRSGGLLKGQTGAVYLALEAPAPILPVVAWGQERVFRSWRLLRRPEIRMRIGSLITLPAGARRRQLDSLSEELMLTLARLLPPPYHGVYAGAVAAEGEIRANEKKRTAERTEVAE